MVKNPLANAGNVGLIPGSGRSPGEGNGNPLQNSCVENSMDRGAWLATVHGFSKSRTRLMTNINLYQLFQKFLKNIKHPQTHFYRPAFGASLLAEMVKTLPAMQENEFDPWIGKIPWRRERQPTPVFLPGESHGQRSPAGNRP